MRGDIIEQLIEAVLVKKKLALELERCHPLNGMRYQHIVQQQANNQAQIDELKADIERQSGG